MKRRKKKILSYLCMKDCCFEVGYTQNPFRPTAILNYRPFQCGIILYVIYFVDFGSVFDLLCVQEILNSVNIAE